MKMTREEFLKRQKEMCRERDAPFFMPRSGYGWGCGGDVVAGEMAEGNDGRILVTGCPFCHRSYCD